MKRPRAHRLAAVGCALTAGMGCASTPDPLSLAPTETLEAQDYPEVLSRWTRSAEIFDGLFSVMYLNASFHAPELRKAFLLRFPESYGRGSDEAERLTLANPDAETHWEFFLSASTPHQAHNDLARPDSIWRVSLRADGGPEVEARVRRVDLNANLRVFYPYVTPFASGYGLEFPLTTLEGTPLIRPETRKVVLRVASALGSAEMEWALSPSAASGT
ncbi:MAG: hypothetical protein AAFU79_30690 [Myxococcota bacterium]